MGRATEVEVRDRPAAAPSIPLPITGALPRRAPPGLRPGPRRAWRPTTLRPGRGARRAGGREVESANGQLVARGIPLPNTGALPRRAPPGLRPGPATCMATGHAASGAWCMLCWRAGGRVRDRPGWDL